MALFDLEYINSGLHNSHPMRVDEVYCLLMSICLFIGLLMSTSINPSNPLNFVVLAFTGAEISTCDSHDGLAVA